MKYKLTLIIIICIQLKAVCQNPLTLWYDKPAKDWNEALPVGNGTIGAMIFGRTGVELIQLNEQTLWTGGPANLNPNLTAFQYLQTARDAILIDSINQAVKLLKKIQGPNTQMYQPMGNIIIKQTFSSEPVNYYRDLNISNATSTTKFTVDGVEYTREIFSSAPDKILIIRIRSSKAHALNFTVDVNNELKYEKLVTTTNELVLKGKARITSDERRNMKTLIYEEPEACYGMRFQFRVKAVNKDGEVSHTDSSLVINNASEVVLYIAAATSFNGYDKCPDKDGKDEVKIASGYLNTALQKNYTQILSAHIKDYQKYFNRLSLNLTGAVDPQLPVDKRLEEYKKGTTDPALEQLYFQFGRYLLISCSRPGGLPANLQGIWNKEIRPSWRSNYTTNINLQMNYWLAEPCNLSDLTQPLTAHIQRLAKNGTATATNYYHMKGWVVHHNSDAWAQTNPVGEGGGDPKWANWALGSPWLSQHLYEHYRFTGNKKYLQDTAYPLMKSAALFCIDWLVEKDGKLITVPSTSPENVYLHPNGFKAAVTIASAMDMEIIWDLFTNIIEAAEVLNTDKEFATLIKQKRALLSPLKIGKKGNLVEWYADWDDEDPQHRHVSQLFALHPGREISPLLDTTYANACRKTLEVRGDGGTGWSKAWKINFWARLLDGNHAYKMYQELLKNSTMNNLFDTHPPFQIDGNFGATAGVAEMLLQSQMDFIQLLPALPTAWANGSIKGICARGGFVIDMDWAAGKLTALKIHSLNGGVCKIQVQGNTLPITKIGLKKMASIAQGNIFECSTVKNGVYIFSFK